LNAFTLVSHMRHAQIDPWEMGWLGASWTKVLGIVNSSSIQIVGGGGGGGGWKASGGRRGGDRNVEPSPEL